MTDTGQSHKVDSHNTGSSFNWSYPLSFAGHARRHVKRNALIILHILAVLFLIILPILLTFYLKILKKYYSLFEYREYSQTLVLVEIVRWCFLFATMYIGFVASLFAIDIITWSLGMATRRVIDSDEPPEQVSQLIVSLRSLRNYIGFAVASLIIMMTSFALFQLDPNAKVGVKDTIIGLFSKAAASEKKKEMAATAKAAGTEATPSESAKKIVIQYSLQYIVTRSCLNLLAFAIILLIEKFLIQRIAVMFHYHSAAGRITENTFVLRTTRRLKTALLDSRRLSLTAIHDAEPRNIGAILFDALCPTGTEAISASSLQPYLNQSDAERYFSLIDPEAHGDIRRSEMALAIQHAFEERDALSQTVTDQTRIIRKVDRLLFVMVIFASFAAGLFIFDADTTTTIATIGSAGVAFTFIFSSAARTSFESIMFVIFSHPFDVGDKILIKNEVYVVKELGLWSSTFFGPGRRLTYITNSLLRSQMIVNVRRSPLQNELITIKILPTSLQEKLTLLESKLNNFLKANSRDYVPPLMLKGYRFIDKDHMVMEMSLQHRSNFQNSELKDARTKNFMLYLKDAVAECGIEFAPSY